MGEYSIQHNSEIQNGPSYAILRKHLIDNFNALDSAIGDRLRTTSGGSPQTITPAVTFTGQITANGGLVTNSSGSLSTNTINELTADNGVFVDRLQVKDGNVRLGTIRGIVTLSTGVNTGTDVFTTDAAHGFTTADPVRVRATSGSTLPTGLAETTQYYARAVTGSTLTLHPTAADATGNTNIVDITAVGSGTMWIVGDVATPSDGDFWYNDGLKVRHLGSTLSLLTTSAGLFYQAVETQKTDTFSTSSTSYTDVTGLSATITPTSASSRILVLVTGMVSSNSSPVQHIKVVRGVTDIFIGAASGSRTQASSGVYTAGTNEIQSLCIAGIDSPATTSATTYKIQTRASSAANVYFNRNDSDTDSAINPRGRSSIILVEIL
jgi:hypothetical protein